MANHELTMTTPIDDRQAPTVGDYNYIILRLRELMKDGSVSSGSLSRPMLILDESGNKNKTNFTRVDVNFTRVRRDGRSVVVKVRFLRDNLYAVACQVGQQWREFEWDRYPNDTRRPRYVPGSLYIAGFNGNYETQPTQLMRLGWQGLGSALDALIDNAALTTPAANRLLAGGLGTVAVMFSEAARFDPILQHVMREIQGSPAIAEWVFTRAKRWSRYCGWIRYYLQHPQEKWELMNLEMAVVKPPGQTAVVTNVEIRTPVQLLELMGIMHNSPEKVQKRKPEDNY